MRNERQPDPYGAWIETGGVEGGVLYHTKGDFTDGWSPYLLFWYGSSGGLVGKLSRPLNFLIPMTGGDLVSAKMMANPQGATSRAKGPGALCIVDPPLGDAVTLVTYGNFRLNDTLRAGRTFAIAQPMFNNAVRNNGYVLSGSHFSFATWSQGQLHVPIGPPQLWNSASTQWQGSFPNISSILSWFVTGAYYSETQQ